jgi:molybdenum cofactor cytidylyltransferase
LKNKYGKVNRCGIVVLAAGESSRLGEPKQLLHYKGKTLVRHVTSIVLQTNISPVVIVVGANNELIANEIIDMPVHISYNKEWQSGMASSLRCGIYAIRKIEPTSDGIIFVVCDQPFLTSSLLANLLLLQNDTCAPIVASSYGGCMGTPALFQKFFFKELVKLNGDYGARKIIANHSKEVTVIPFPKGEIDIDTTDDLINLYQG